MNVDIKFNLPKFEQQVETFRKRFLLAGKRSVLRMSKEVLTEIIDETAGAAPPPPVIYYKRTGQWLGGWGNAAAYLEIPLHPTENTPRISRITGHSYTLEDEHEYSFRAVNDVVYAEYIERTGTWKTPYDTRRAGYKYVADAINSEKNEERFKEIIKENIESII